MKSLIRTKAASLIMHRLSVDLLSYPSSPKAEINIKEAIGTEDEGPLS